jgi:hypothetical protein
MLGRWALKFYEQLIINCAVLCDGCSGSDGLVKIWNVRTNECVTTLDQHTEKVWSIASSEDGNWLASGGADSLICLWKDVTEKVVAEKQEARDRQILQEQELSNYLQQRDFVQAVGVAINLDQPFRVYTILSGSRCTLTLASRPNSIHSLEHGISETLQNIV